MTNAYRVLIVEDEVMLALELEAELQSMGIMVCGIAPNIGDAVALTMKEKPNLVMSSSGGATGRRGNRALAWRDVRSSRCFCDSLRR